MQEKRNTSLQNDAVETRRSAAGEILTTFLFYLAILFFIIGFNFTDRMAGNWYQQFLPFPAGGQVKDIFFVDSLLGFAVTDSSILKTTNSGDNWAVKQSGYYIFQRIQFLNANTGYACGGNNRLLKTTNSGENWTIDTPASIFPNDMHVVSEDTIWLVSSSNPTGGVYRTTNSGGVWEQQLFLGSQNPSKIYMYNSIIGFVSSTAGLYKTTDSGENWFNASNDFSFSDMFFINSSTGWKASGLIKKTTNGGLNWVNQPIPQGGTIMGNGAIRFMNKDNDTIWAVGESIIVPGSPPTRGILFRTTNGGNIWQYQVPDTAVHINRYFFGQFINKRLGWAYSFNPTGIHTTNGGDTNFITGIQQVSSQIPKEFKLFQNYPNPFNPKTIIRFEIKRPADIELSIYDIQGKLVTQLVNQKHDAGTYEVDFSGYRYSSGVYFYRLTAVSATGSRKEVFTDTKKMLLIK